MVIASSDPATASCADGIMRFQRPSLGREEQLPQMHPPSGWARLAHVQLRPGRAVGVEVDFSAAPVSHSHCLDGAPALPVAQMLLCVVCQNQRKGSSGRVEGMDFAQCVNSHSVVN